MLDGSPGVSAGKFAWASYHHGTYQATPYENIAAWHSNYQ
jgi:hypothetical protein